jgi:hypothetical protein
MLTKTKTISLLATLALASGLGLTACGGGGTSTTEKTETKTEAPATGTGSAPATATTETKPDGGVMGAAMSAADKAKLTPVKTALVMANTAVKGGKFDEAKSQFTKFDGLWKMAEPMVKEKAGDKYPLIEKGIGMVKTHLVDAKTPDKAKASEGLTGAIQAIDAVMNKK